MSSERVVVVDDDKSIANLIMNYLQGEGFEITVATDGNEALQVIEDNPPDIVILDLMLPGLNGFEVLKKIREWSRMPVITLSARGEMQYKTQCLNLGADDYITKPFNLEELLARLNAVLRRTNSSDEQPLPAFRCGAVHIDYENRVVMVEGNEISLSPLEFKLLRELTSQAGKIIDHHYLLKTVWGPEYVSEREYLHVYIGQLRSKIEKHPDDPQYIITVPRVGYKFNLPDR